MASLKTSGLHIVLRQTGRQMWHLCMSAEICESALQKHINQEGLQYFNSLRFGLIMAV